jgi:hypothetical protein
MGDASTQNPKAKNNRPPPPSFYKQNKICEADMRSIWSRSSMHSVTAKEHQQADFQLGSVSHSKHKSIEAYLGYHCYRRSVLAMNALMQQLFVEALRARHVSISFIELSRGFHDSTD